MKSTDNRTEQELKELAERFHWHPSFCDFAGLLKTWSDVAYRMDELEMNSPEIHKRFLAVVTREVGRLS